MINENTLKTLNKKAFGADIDSLESYIIDFKQANLVCNMDRYETNYLMLVKLLKEIKSDSKAFSDTTSLVESETDKFDKFFTEYGNHRHNIMYGEEHNGFFNDFEDSILECDDHVTDIVALTNITGVDIICNYINGILYKTFLVGTDCKYTDISDLAKKLLPDRVENFKKYGLVECRGKLTIFNTHPDTQNISLNLESSVMRCLRDNIYLDDLSIVLNDIFIETEDLPFENQWEKIEYMRDSGLSVPHHGLIRCVESDMVDSALKELDNYFDDIQNTDGIIYDYNGIVIRLNDWLNCTDETSTFIYKSREVDPRQRFSSTVKSISQSSSESNQQVLNIVKIQCNDKLTIDYIDLDDIYDIEKYNIHIGGKVVFNVVEGKAVICD